MIRERRLRDSRAAESEVPTLNSVVFSISEAGMIMGFKQGKGCVIRHAQCFTAPAAAAIESNSARVYVDTDNSPSRQIFAEMGD